MTWCGSATRVLPHLPEFWVQKLIVINFKQQKMII
uniref:Uncharacterized protein n=1 Tax=Rhizophora mucronata TaxID=61149 RepID=A0A2P2PJD5_RHIMU